MCHIHKHPVLVKYYRFWLESFCCPILPAELSQTQETQTWQPAQPHCNSPLPLGGRYLINRHLCVCVCLCAYVSVSDLCAPSSFHCEVNATGRRSWYPQGCLSVTLVHARTDTHSLTHNGGSQTCREKCS